MPMVSGSTVALLTFSLFFSLLFFRLCVGVTFKRGQCCQVRIGVRLGLGFGYYYGQVNVNLVLGQGYVSISLALGQLFLSVRLGIGQDQNYIGLGLVLAQCQVRARLGLGKCQFSIWLAQCQVSLALGYGQARVKLSLRLRLWLRIGKYVVGLSFTFIYFLSTTQAFCCCHPGGRIDTAVLKCTSQEVQTFLLTILCKYIKIKTKYNKRVARTDHCDCLVTVFIRAKFCTEF